MVNSKQMYIVVRVDNEEAVPESIMLTKAFTNEDDAENEAKRLNELNSDKGAQYFVRLARLAVQ